jgi:hypothetical protein
MVHDFSIPGSYSSPPGNRRTKIAEISRANVANPSPCPRQTESWQFMTLYKGRFPHAGRWLKQKRVSGSR